MKNIELGRIIHANLRTDLSFEDWYQDCFKECMEEVLYNYMNNEHSNISEYKDGWTLEISKFVSKSNSVIRINFEYENFVEYFGSEEACKEYFEC